jgi:hypothetical protein
MTGPHLDQQDVAVRVAMEAGLDIQVAAECVGVVDRADGVVEPGECLREAGISFVLDCLPIMTLPVGHIPRA